jgi:excisionase family DNA binding protein
MRLSLSEAATVLGKSERQIRYLIKSGHLTASKEGGQWRVTDLLLTEGQRRSLAERLGAARAAFDKGDGGGREMPAPQRGAGM